MDMAAILFNGTEPFEQIVNMPLTEGPMWDLVKIGEAVSEKFKDFMILYLYIAQDNGRQPLGCRGDGGGGAKFICN